jgi:hypothetical protein
VRQASTKAGIEVWADAKAFVARGSPHYASVGLEGPLAEEAMKLNIPRIPEHKGGKYGLSMQTYNDFATEAKRKNRYVSFSKDLMDVVFRISTTRLPKYPVWEAYKQAMVDRVSSPSWVTSVISLTAGHSVSARNQIGIGKMAHDGDP